MLCYGSLSSFSRIGIWLNPALVSPAYLFPGKRQELQGKPIGSAYLERLNNL